MRLEDLWKREASHFPREQMVRRPSKERRTWGDMAIMQSAFPLSPFLGVSDTGNAVAGLGTELSLVNLAVADLSRVLFRKACRSDERVDDIGNLLQ